jgi:hypothetical protein
VIAEESPMEVTTVVDNEFISVRFHPREKIVHHELHQFVFGERFREGLLAGVELLEQHGATKWLSDDRKNSALPSADVEWGKREWFPRALAAGWKYWALVQPEAAVGQMNMRRISHAYALAGVTVRVFDDASEALEWLASL